MLNRLDDLFAGHDAVLCDVWGVIHNGVTAWPQAHQALSRAREAGLAVVMITNAPRPNEPVARQLLSLGVPQSAFDAVTTSGDVTRALIAAGPRKVLHIGPERDLAIFDGLDVELVEEFEASGAVCTGLYDDTTEGPEDYHDLLQRLRSRDLPFICANPDIVVDRGGETIYCAGAIARQYTLIGGRTQIAGKPFAPIYDAAIEKAQAALGRPLDRSRVLAIGDGVLTDVKGAVDYGLGLVFITDGIHAREYGEPGRPDPAALGEWLAKAGAAPAGVMTMLA